MDCNTQSAYDCFVAWAEQQNHSLHPPHVLAVLKHLAMHEMLESHDFYQPHTKYRLQLIDNVQKSLT